MNMHHPQGTEQRDDGLAPTAGVTLWRKHGDTYLPLFTARAKDGDDYMLSFTGQISQLYCAEAPSGENDITPQDETPEQPLYVSKGCDPGETRKRVEYVTLLFATGQSNVLSGI